MMQRNLSCRNSKEAAKSVLLGAGVQFVIIFLFLMLGVLMLRYFNLETFGAKGAPAEDVISRLSGSTDNLFPTVVASKGMPSVAVFLFVLGLCAASYSTAGAALTALTTSFTIDILKADRKKEGNSLMYDIAIIGSGITGAATAYTLSQYDLSSLKEATTAGEALNTEAYYRFEHATGLKIRQGFGQTETALCIATLRGMVNKEGSMGKPVPGFDIDIMNHDGQLCASGESGEIVIRTSEGIPNGLFSGYFNDEEETASKWHDGWYHTGDAAWKDEDGYFRYIGRVDDVIKSSGYRIGPFEIEDIILKLPYVRECGVSAAPDEVRGQVVKASIVLAPGVEGTDELKKEIQDYVKTHTAPYKYPRIIVFRDSLPKTISGKVIRNQL